MASDHTLWKCLNVWNADLLDLARAALEVHAFLDLVIQEGLSWRECRDGGTRDFSVRLPTERLATFIQTLQSQGIRFGTVDCRTAAALAICQRLGVAAERDDPLDAAG